MRTNASGPKQTGPSREHAMKGDFTTREEIYDVYQKRASIYELAVHGCYLLGFPIGRYRRLAVEALAPRPGDTVV